ncbi:MAG: RsmD family RNA methyltransferase [Myxococcota bacterium]
MEGSAGPFFVAGTAPGDRIRHGPVEMRGGVARARLLEVLAPGAGRREPPCPRAARCGGCGWMHLDADAQRDAKRARVRRALAPLEPPDLLELVQAEALGYRVRARLAWRGGTLGYRARRRRDVVEAPDCAVLVPALAAVLPALGALGLRGDGELHLGLRDGRPLAVLASPSAQPPEVYAALAGLVDASRLAGARLTCEGVSATWGASEERREGADGLPLVASAGGFAQAHGTLERVLTEAVVAAAAPAGKRVLELYAGHGMLSVALARDAERLVAVEQDAVAAEACRTNLAARGLRAEVRAVDARSALERPSFAPDVLVVDPPRAGIGDARERVVGLGAPRLVYVSCEPATLASDLRALASAGYRLEEARAFDLFPQTPHVETLVTLVRA